MSGPLQNLVAGRRRDGRDAATVDLNPARPAQQVAAGALATTADAAARAAQDGVPAGG